MASTVQVPADWWVARGGYGDPTIWQPGRSPAFPMPVAARFEVPAAIWDLLAAALPDRGDCPDCTAVPCNQHQEK